MEENNNFKKEQNISDVNNEINSDSKIDEINLSKTSSFKNETKPIKNKKDKLKNKHKDSFWRWPLFVLFLTLTLSALFSFGSELALKDANLIISIILLIIFIGLAMICDMLGVAVTAAELEPFIAMSSKRVKGSKMAIKLVKNNAKFSSIFCDVIGDICGILSGAIGTSILAHIVINGEMLQVVIASIISAIIASLTVFLKAVGKKIAIKNANSIVFVLAKVLSVFSKEK